MTIESARRWAAAHPEENRAKARAWYNANADRSIEVSTAWKRDNPEAVRRHNRTHYVKAHPRPLCPMCGKRIQKRQVTFCRDCAHLNKLSRTQEWRARHRTPRPFKPTPTTYVAPKGPYRRRTAA